jgi:hypothetical protein
VCTYIYVAEKGCGGGGGGGKGFLMCREIVKNHKVPSAHAARPGGGGSSGTPAVDGLYLSFFFFFFYKYKPQH